MRKFAQDLSTIWGAGILTATLVALFLHVIRDDLAYVLAAGASAMIVIPQKIPMTTVHTENAIVANTVVQSEAVPVVEKKV